LREGVDGAWWLSWSSKPVRPDDVGLGGFDSHTLPPACGVSRVVRTLRHFALVALAAVLPATVAAQVPDSTRRPVSDSGFSPVIKPPVSPRRAFLSSLAMPGYGQAMLGRKRSGAMMLAFEAVSVVMIRETALGVREARRNSADSVIVSWVDPNGLPAIRYARTSFPAGLVRARKEQMEDWIAVLVANHLFSGADAFVAALLWDLPAELAVTSSARSSTNVGLRVRF